jgi:cobalt-zinc-cadmium efflux system outer membrane protein
MHRLATTLCSTVAVAWLPLPSRADVATTTLTLTLDTALQSALDSHPAIAAAQAALDEARGQRLGAGVFANPEFSAKGAARLLDEGPRPDIAVEIGQPIALGDVRGARIAVAESEVHQATLSLTHARQALASRVQLAFIEARRADELSELAGASVQLARRLLLASERRLSEGDSTVLDVHVSKAELGRAENALTQARVDVVAARVTLAEAIGWDVLRPFRVGPVPRPDRVLPPLPAVLAEARRRRTDLEGLRTTVETGRARLDLARAAAAPSLTVSAFFELEGGSDVILGGGVSLPIPLFDRNQSAIAEATARVARHHAELRLGERTVDREVATAYELYASASLAERAYADHVVGSLEETVDLLQRSFDAGKISFSEVLVLRRSLIEARAIAVETRARAAQASVVLDVALGTIALPRSAAQEQP